MHKSVTFFACVFVILFSTSLYSQVFHSESELIKPDNNGINLNFSVGDTSLLYDLIHGNLQSPLRSFFMRHDSTDDDLWAIPDSTDDSLLLDMKVGNFTGKHHKRHSFLINEPPYDREIPHLESMPFLDYNRVNGFYLGFATPTMVDFGRHDEFGVKASIGYGFVEKKGQSQFAGEYRLPLGSNDTSVAVEKWKAVPTLAFGIEYHDVTTTNDAWRAERGENAIYAFFAREDFRDYFKIEGWNAYAAFRPEKKSEFRIEYRSDVYYDQPQRILHGNWGTSKSLPPNPAVTDGTMNSWVFTAGREDAHSQDIKAKNIWGDEVNYTRMTGQVYFLQAEFGKNVGADSSFQRYILDVRSFNPVIPGISFDTRFRLESGTNDIPIQMEQYLGGPSSLPALKNKVIAGNRLVLLNTELRLNLAGLSSIFTDSPELLILNDFGFCKQVPMDNTIFQGFGDMTFSTIVYNIGVGLGHPSGIQFGVTWRTDVKETGRFFFRFQRPF
jgi:hypothetical protein